MQADILQLPITQDPKPYLEAQKQWQWHGGAAAVLVVTITALAITRINRYILGAGGASGVMGCEYMANRAIAIPIFDTLEAAPFDLETFDQHGQVSTSDFSRICTLGEDTVAVNAIGDAIGESKDRDVVKLRSLLKEQTEDEQIVVLRLAKHAMVAGKGGHVYLVKRETGWLQKVKRAEDGSAIVLLLEGFTLLVTEKALSQNEWQSTLYAGGAAMDVFKNTAKKLGEMLQRLGAAFSV